MATASSTTFNSIYKPQMVPITIDAAWDDAQQSTNKQNALNRLPLNIDFHPEKNSIATMKRYTFPN